MLEEVTKIVYAIIFSVYNFIAVKKILKSDVNFFSIKTIILIIVEVISYSVLYSISYNLKIILLRTIIQVIINMIIFEKYYLKTLITYIIVVLIMLLSDMINSVIYIHIWPLDIARSNAKIMLLSNTTVFVTMFIIIQIKPLIKIISKFIENINIKDDYDKIVFIILLLTGIINIYYNILSIYKFNIIYFVNLVIIIIALVIFYIFLNRSINYDNLLKEYDSLFLYIQDFEEIIDNISINNHELKNQLVVLRTYIDLNKKKEAKKLINDITGTTIKSDEETAITLRNIPKGGLKGLLYYKILIAKAKNINVEIDISNNVKNVLDKFDINQNKVLCEIIGIYLDNAIEACILTKKKIIAIEIYSLDNNINFVISNTFINKTLNINKIGKRGYTTKGKGHGKGTYLAGKLINKNDWIESNNKIVKNLFVQKIIIHNDKEKTDN